MTVTCLRFANVYGPHIDCLRKQPPFVGYMIRELYYDRTPEFHSDGNQRRDYIYVDDLIALALRVVEQPQKGFDAVNVSSNRSYSVKELYAIASRLMGKNIEAKYCPSSHYWAKYPELYGGAYGIKPEILDHEVNKFSQCDNTHAREVYGWQPQVDIETGLGRVIEAETRMLAGLEKVKKASPSGKLSPQATDEGRVNGATLLRKIAQAMAAGRPSSGAARHLPPRGRLFEKGTSCLNFT